MKIVRYLNKICLIIGYGFLTAVISVFIWMSVSEKQLTETFPRELIGDKSSFSVCPDEVHIFYEALINGNWEKTYELRTSEFREDVQKGEYIRNLRNSECKVRSYEVSEVRWKNNSQFDLVMRFKERKFQTCGVARWVKEQNGWRCEDVGLNSIIYFRSLRSK